jgi:hypothetical protein
MSAWNRWGAKNYEIYLGITLRIAADHSYILLLNQYHVILSNTTQIINQKSYQSNKKRHGG